MTIFQFTVLFIIHLLNCKITSWAQSADLCRPIWRTGRLDKCCLNSSLSQARLTMTFSQELSNSKARKLSSDTGRLGWGWGNAWID
jgi:hypothetical protein